MAVVHHHRTLYIQPAGKDKPGDLLKEKTASHHLAVTLYAVVKRRGESNPRLFNDAVFSPSGQTQKQLVRAGRTEVVISGPARTEQ
ncbi:unnamed protein product [Pleuronectes platessa]|uniref:Uncharacterized protein n=1 Tax=Pleuronectes platessa TaxID=8262 RepID=A0A9N7Y324_PLEPL|nr:unnamed protein product [Pleuronectes platessa]